MPSRNSADVAVIDGNEGPAGQTPVSGVSPDGDTMSHPERPRPLIPSDSCKTIPISIVLDGVEATGEIVFLNSTDLQVAILSPVSGFGTSLHVPWFAAGCASNWLATEAGITEYGTHSAKRVAQGAVRYVQGRPSGWGIDKIEADGTWTDIYPIPQR